MSAQDELDHIIQENHEWLAEFIGGNVEPAKNMFSHKDDVSLAGPQPTAHRGSIPIAHGWDVVRKTLDSAVAYFREGRVISFDNIAKYIDHDLAFSVEVERFYSRVGDARDLVPVSLRVTSIFRREENGVWKVLHRHADPVTSVAPPESIAEHPS